MFGLALLSPEEEKKIKNCWACLVAKTQDVLLLCKLGVCVTVAGSMMLDLK
jgi:hypothetical protein